MADTVGTTVVGYHDGDQEYRPAERLKDALAEVIEAISVNTKSTELAVEKTAAATILDVEKTAAAINLAVEKTAAASELAVTKSGGELSRQIDVVGAASVLAISQGFAGVQKSLCEGFSAVITEGLKAAHIAEVRAMSNFKDLTLQASENTAAIKMFVDSECEEVSEKIDAQVTAQLIKDAAAKDSEIAYLRMKAEFRRDDCHNGNYSWGNQGGNQGGGFGPGGNGGPGPGPR